jgi:hypothetical protein
VSSLMRVYEGEYVIDASLSSTADIQYWLAECKLCNRDDGKRWIPRNGGKHTQATVEAVMDKHMARWHRG